jgi:hypothetical protein
LPISAGGPRNYKKVIIVIADPDDFVIATKSCPLLFTVRGIYLEKLSVGSMEDGLHAVGIDPLRVLTKIRFLSVTRCRSSFHVCVREDVVEGRAARIDVDFFLWMCR